MTLSAATLAAGDSVTATIANGPGLARDWVGLYSSNGATLLNWKYLNGSQTVPGSGLHQRGRVDADADHTWLLPSPVRERQHHPGDEPRRYRAVTRGAVRPGVPAILDGT